MSYKTIGLLLCILLVVVISAVTPTGIRLWNEAKYRNQVAFTETDYATLKKVEDTCRAEIATYEAYVAAYEAYQVAGQTQNALTTKISANNVASRYNSYILKNNYIWGKNVPLDIRDKLPLLD